MKNNCRHALMAAVGAALVIGSAATAAANIYQWTDENGRTVFSSTAPKDRPSTKASVKVGPARPPPARQEPSSPPAPAGQSPGAPVAQPRPDPKIAAENCAKARQVLKVLDETPRPRFTDTDGQIKFMDEGQKAQRRAEARRVVEEDCR